jgi:hypothetical protein
MERTVKVQLLQMSMKLELPMLTLMNTFTQSKDAILILDGYMMALMHDINLYYLYVNQNDFVSDIQIPSR